MSDLVEFLRARLDEEEEAARAAIAERVRVSRDGEEPDWRFAYWPDLGAPAVVVGGERVLADVEAKRRIVEREVNSLTPLPGDASSFYATSRPCTPSTRTTRSPGAADRAHVRVHGHARRATDALIRVRCAGVFQPCDLRFCR